MKQLLNPGNWENILNHYYVKCSQQYLRQHVNQSCEDTRDWKFSLLRVKVECSIRNDKSEIELISI